MKKLIIGIILIPLFSTGCPRRPCPNYNGYGRYTLSVDCESVRINGKTYQLKWAQDQNNLAIAGHTISRGIMRKTEPWLYIHMMDLQTKRAEITFDNGEKPNYPLYVGSAGAINVIYDQLVDIKKSTCIEFPDKYWLVCHRWKNNGVYFDLQQNTGDAEQWQLIKEIFVPDGGSQTVEIISAKITVTSCNEAQETASIRFAAVN